MTGHTRRSPDQILTDFDAGCIGTADIDMRAVLWEVIEDVADSYDKAMRESVIGTGYFEEVHDTVLDYLMNNYGDD